MKTPDIPPDEQVRLKTLRSLDLIDTPSEDRFDRLTRMAMRIFSVPISLICLVDENRVWMKSYLGLSVSEGPRDTSFCGHAILGSDTFIVPDATKDKRFADNPAVVSGLNVRFYAGYPLKVKNSRVGTLCVVDTKPRNFSNEDIELIKDLARMVEYELIAIQMTTQDVMTKLPNKRGFISIANKILSLSIRNKIPVLLAFFKFNELKSINEEFGQSEGDHALIEFAQQLESSFLESDAIARLDEDEFVMLFTGTSKENAEAKMTRFKTFLENRNNELNRGYNISFSYNLFAFKPEIHNTIENLLEEANTLMGKNNNIQKKDGD